MGIEFKSYDEALEVFTLGNKNTWKEKTDYY